MEWKFAVRSSVVSMAIVLGQVFLLPAYSQENPNVSMVRLTVQQNADGRQSVVTPKGMLVPMPGSGVSTNYLDLYMGSNGGFWYVDRTGKTVDITSYVQQVRAQSAPMQTATAPQYAPYESSSNNGSTALAAGTAAGVGAMVGAGMARIPYGSPMYYGAHGNPYYRNVEGKDVFVDDGEVQWDNVSKAQSAKKSRQTEKVNKAKEYQQQRTGEQQAQHQQMMAGMQANQQHNQGNRNANMQAQNFQQQQQWYQQQSKDKGKSKRWKEESAGDNPFVRSQGESRADRSRGSREARSGGGRSSRGGGRSSRGGGGRRGR